MAAARGAFTIKRQAGRREEERVLTLEVAGWLASTIGCDDAGEELFRAEGLQTGVWLCQLLSQTLPEEATAHAPKCPHPDAKPLTFQARDNLSTFIDAVMGMGVHAIRRVEVEDIVAHRNIRGVLYFVLSLARDLYQKYGVRPPEVVAMELEIDDLRLQEPQNTDGHEVERARALEHEPYVAAEGDYIDRWIAAFVNQNRVPLVAVPARLPVPPEGGQYIFPFEPRPHTIYYVRMVRGTPLYRDGGEWKELAELIRSKMAAAYAEAGLEMPKLELPKGVRPPRPAGEAVVQEAMARREELKEIERDNCIYVAGRDEKGRHVLVVVGSRLPPLSDERMQKVLLYLALTLDKIGRSEYTAVYCHTRARFARRYVHWIKEARARLPYTFKKNLKDLHVVHPSFFIKACFGFLRPFISDKFWRKLHYYNSRSTDQINERIRPLEAGRILPAFVNLHGKHNYEAGRLFGGTLDTAAVRDLGQGEQYAVRVPRVVYETVEYLRSSALDAEGIFRVPGPKKDEEAVRALYEKDDDVPWLRGSWSAHVAASVLKAYVRELGEPLVPEAEFEEMLRVGAAAGGDGDPPVAAAQALLARVPDANRRVLAYLCHFLSQVARHAENNKMTASNLAVVFAPNVVRHRDEADADMLANTKKKVSAMQLLIERADELFAADDAAAAAEEDADEQAQEQAGAEAAAE